MKNLKKIPQFKTEDKEREFWSKHDSADYLDWSKSYRAIFSKLRPSTKTISIRLPESLLHRIKNQARKQDVPYQSYIKVFLYKHIEDKQYKTKNRP